MSSDIYKVELINIFEGPMDLLIHLIRKNEVNIYEIPISQITDRYLEYIEWMKSMNVDIAGDFLVMAATLIQIKSRMLLPVHDDSDEKDPSLEITKPLLEYLYIKSAAGALSKREFLGEHTFIRPQVKTHSPGDPLHDHEIRVDLFELFLAFERILEKLPSDISIELSAEKTSVYDRMAEIISLLSEKKTLSFYELVCSYPVKSQIIISFLAILEIVKNNKAVLIQNTDTGIIRLFLNERDHA